MLLYAIIHGISGKAIGLKVYYMPTKGMNITMIKHVYMNIANVNGKYKMLDV